MVKGQKGDWVRVGTDGEIKGKCARVGEGKPKCMPRSKATVCPRMTGQLLPDVNAEKTPLQIEKVVWQEVGKPIMVKTDVKEGKMSAADRFAKRLKDKHGMDLDAKLKYYEDMKKKMQQTSEGVKSEENNLEEMPR